MNKFMRLIGALLCIWLALWRSIGDRWGWLGMLNAWAEWGMGTLGLLALRAALRRRWLQSAALLGVMALGAEHYLAASRLSNPNQSQNQDPTFTIFGANLYQRNASAAAHIALIRQHQPDVVCLQELTLQLADQFLSALGDEYPFRAWQPQASAYGYGVLSRFPVAQTGHWVTPGVRAWGQRVALTLPSEEMVELYNVHLVPPTAGSTLRQGMTWGFRVREKQMQVMQQEIKKRGYPACIIGDCNFTDSSDVYRIACEELNDSWLAVGRGKRWTWPTRAFPLKLLPWSPRMLRLDYCFHNEQLTPHAMQVLTARTGSDHCPLIVTFSVK